MMRHTLLHLLTAACGVALTPLAAAQNDPPLVAREVVILLVDNFGEVANETGLFGSTLPAGAQSRRETADAPGAMPGGFLTFNGGSGDIPPFDALVELAVGSFVGAWPQPERRRADRVLWRDLRVLANETPVAPTALPEGHWMVPLRSADRRLLQADRSAERFLFYDAAVKYAVPFTVRGEAGGYRLESKRDEPLGEVLLVKPTGGGEYATWSRASALPPESDSPTASKQAAPEASVKVSFDDNLRPAATQPATTQPAATRPATQPNVRGASPGAAILQPLDSAVPSPAQALAGMAATLRNLGTLGEPEIAFAQAVLERHAIDEQGLTVIYRLDPAVLDRLLPLDIAPAPDEVHRVGLVIVRNADPAVGERIAALVAQLGADTWSERDRAQQLLATFGPAAKPTLEKHQGDADPEVRYRVRQLLETPAVAE